MDEKNTSNTGTIVGDKTGVQAQPGSKFNRKDGKPSNHRNDRRDSKEDGKKGKEKRKENPCKHFNSPEFYKPSEALAKDVSNISFGNILGQAMPSLISVSDSDGNTIPVPTPRTPGVAALRFAPYYGVTSSEAIAASEAPVNVAGQKLYAYIRSRNNGAKVYDPVDVMQIVIACDSLLMWYAELCRVYGVLMNYDAYSRYTPKCIVEALGFNYESLKENMLELRVLINSLAAQIEVFAIPADLAVIHRHYEMCRYVFAESDDPRAQIYCNVPEFEYRWSNVDGVVKLVADNIKGTVLIDMSRARLFTKNLIDPIFYNEDVALIMGDMRKTDMKFMTVNAIPDDYKVAPVFGEDALRQMKCAMPIGVPGNHPNWVYAQQNGRLVVNSVFSMSEDPWAAYLTNVRQRYLFAKRALTNDEVLVSSRFQPLLKITNARVSQDNNVNYDIEVIAAGTEIPLRWKLYVASGTGSFSSRDYFGSVLYFGYNPDIGETWVGYPSGYVNYIEWLAPQFKWITPLVRVVLDGFTGDVSVEGNPIMIPAQPSTDNAGYYNAIFGTPIDGLATYANANQPGGGLASLHEVALLGEFDIKASSKT